MAPFRARKRFETILARSGRGPLFSIEAVLGLLSTVYGGAMALRAGLYRRGVVPARRLSCPVVSVGNLTLGGTGKTPMVVYLAERLRASGLRPAVVSRGYGGRMQGPGGVVSDGRRLLVPPVAAGDEPWMIAHRLPGVPVVVGGNRYRAGRLAQQIFSPDLVLLDDGFQHLRLQRDLDLLLLDAGAPLGNGRIFPRGVLREPPSAAARADALVFTRTGGAPADDLLTRRRCFQGKPVCRAVHVPCVRRIVPPSGGGVPAARVEANADLLKKRVFAFSGIARNEAFVASIRSLGGQMVAFRGFADHHRYRAQERLELDAAAHRAGVDLVVTTEKDFARLGGQNPFKLALAVVGVDLDLVSGKAALDRLLMQRVAAHGGY